MSYVGTYLFNSLCDLEFIHDTANLVSPEVKVNGCQLLFVCFVENKLLSNLLV